MDDEEESVQQANSYDKLLKQVGMASLDEIYQDR